MSRRFLLEVTAWLLRAKSSDQRRKDPGQPRILVIRRNRLGDMICTLPLLHALRRHFPQAYLSVACDAPGRPIAQACGAVNEVISLVKGFRPAALYRNARRLQGFDWVLAAKGGFDRYLAALARLSNGARRIGFEERPGEGAPYYSDPLTFPDKNTEHQIETLLRLLAPLGISGEEPISLHLDLPEAARDFGAARLAAPPFGKASRFMLINVSSTSAVRFGAGDFLALTACALAATDWAVGFVSAPEDQARARELATQAGSERVAAVPTPGPLELAALLERAAVLVTPEGGAAHLAAAMGTAAVVLWSEGPFEKWRSRGERHVFSRAEPGERTLGVDRVWRGVREATEPLISLKK